MGLGMKNNPHEDENLDFKGILAPYWKDMSYEEMEHILHTAKQKWLEKLFRQLDGDFDADTENPE
jgi:hypothetical protein